MNVEWTPDAIVQTNEMLQYTELYFGKKAAKRIAKEIASNNRRLVDNPHLGPIEPILSHRTKEYRHINVDSNYKMLYYVAHDTIYVVGLWHQSRNPKRMSSIIK